MHSTFVVRERRDGEEEYNKRNPNDSCESSDEESSSRSFGAILASKNVQETRCAICKNLFQDYSVIDCCCHSFCFQCILKCSKVKSECPICKTYFKSILGTLSSENGVCIYYPYSDCFEEREVPFTAILHAYIKRLLQHYKARPNLYLKNFIRVAVSHSFSSAPYRVLMRVPVPATVSQQSAGTSSQQSAGSASSSKCSGNSTLKSFVSKCEHGDSIH